MNKYNQLRAAIAAIRRNNRALLAVLPQWRCESGDEAVCLADIGDLALKKIACAIGKRDRGIGNRKRSRADGEGRRGPQTAFMAKQRKVFLEYLKVHPETASVSRIMEGQQAYDSKMRSG